MPYINIKDGENNTMRMFKSEYNGEILQHSTSFVNIAQALESLKKFEAREDDIWILSYPKSGTHWLYEILGILLSGKLQNLSSYTTASMLEAQKDFADIPPLHGRRFISTHLRRDFLPKDILKKSKVVYIARNPKSVAVSYYNHSSFLKSYDYSGTFNGYLPLFVNGHNDICGTWFDHVPEYWQEAQNNPNIHFVFYEELSRNPTKCIQDVSNFIGLDRSESFCQQVAELASFEHMKNGTGKSEEQKKQYRNISKFGELSFFRTGTINDWKNVFTVTQNEMFDNIYNERMKSYPKLMEKIQFS